MTREEAIKILRGLKADNLNISDLYTRNKYEALAMAIEALKQPEIVTCEHCKYWMKDDGKLPFKNIVYHYCVMCDGNTDSDDFCKEGERED